MISFTNALLPEKSLFRDNTKRVFKKCNTSFKCEIRITSASLRGQNTFGI